MSLVSVPIFRNLKLSGQCSVPLSPLLRPCSDGGASFISSTGIDVDCVFTYKVPDKAMLVVRFSVPSERSNGSNNFAVAIREPTECDQNVLKHMTKGSEKGGLHSKSNRHARPQPSAKDMT